MDIKNKNKLMKKKISRSIIQRMMVLELLKQLGRDIYKCEVCKVKFEKLKGKRQLIIHHIDNNPLNNDLKNLQIVCNKCHGQSTSFPKRMGKINPNWKGLRGMTNCDNCEKRHLHLNYYKAKHHFCSRECHREYLKKHSKKNREKT